MGRAGIEPATLGLKVPGNRSLLLPRFGVAGRILALGHAVRTRLAGRNRSPVDVSHHMSHPGRLHKWRLHQNSRKVT